MGGAPSRLGCDRPSRDRDRPVAHESDFLRSTEATVTGIVQTVEPSVTSDVASAPKSSDSVLRRFAEQSGLTALDVTIGVLVGLFMVFWMPLFITSDMPRNALAVALLPLGVGLVLDAAVHRDRAALAALGCCLVIVVSGLQAVNVRAAFSGQMPEWNSVIALVASIGFWGLGRALSQGGRLFAVHALTAGALLNGIVGAAQMVGRVDSGDLVIAGGRASGLMSNPAFYGSVMVGLAAAWTAFACEKRTAWHLSLTGLLVFFTSLSGGRVTLAAIVGVWLASAILWRRGALVPIGVGAVGVAAGDVFARLVSGSNSTFQRLGGSDSFSGRREVWGFALEAFADRPVLGWGPANAEYAVMRRLDFAYVQRYWGDGLTVIWWDPHNVIVFVLLSVGLVGALALAIFVSFALRGEIRWPWLLGAGAIAATWMLQPITVHSVPIALFLLGAAVRSRIVRPDDTPHSGPVAPRGADGGFRVRTWQGALLGVGAVYLVLILSAAFVFQRSIEQRDPERAAAVAPLFGGDPWIRLYVSNAYRASAVPGPDGDPFLDAAVRHAARAVDLYPTSEHNQLLADVAVAAGEDSVALDASLAAVDELPWDPNANLRLYTVAEHLGETTLAGRAAARLCAISDYWCSAVPADPGPRGEASDPP
jgi:O-antigen ligase